MNTLRLNIAIAILFLLIGGTLNAQLSINEWMPDNVQAIPDEFGEYDDWIELYNSSDAPIDLQGYYLSDDDSNPLKFQISDSYIIPADGFILFWADKDVDQGTGHLGFKLSSTGESILLSDPIGNLLDVVEFGNISTDFSMGAFPNGSNNFFFFEDDTPGTSNDIIGDPAGLESPVISIKSGFYPSNIDVNLSASDPSIDIYYTLDGSAPNENSFLFSGSILIDHTTVLRAISRKDGFPNSEISSAIYYFGVSTTLPTLSIIGDPNDFFGLEGIYSNPYESGSDWERYCQIQYFENDQLEFDVNCGIRIQGSSSVGNDKKSFRLFFESEYGQKWLDYDLFEENEVDRFRNLVLRSGYDDDLTNSTGTLLRDPFCSNEYKKLDGLTSDAKWVTLTINGDYWGIYEIRESVNEHFIKSQNDWDEFDMIRFTKQGPELKEGSMEDWDMMTDFLMNNDLSDSSNYKIATSLIDEENLINLLAFVNTTAYSSWTWGVSAYKNSNASSKWKFTVWDMDRSLFQNGWNNFDEFENTDGIYWANFIPQAFIENIDFRNKLLIKTADLINSDFRSNEALASLEIVKNEIAAEIDDELNRWVPGGTYADWEEEVGDVEYFVDNRGETILEHALGRFDIPATNKIVLDIDGMGDLQVNSLSVGEFPWEGKYFESIPTSIIAQPNPGYYFSHWSDSNIPNESSVSIDYSGTKQLTAHFESGNTDSHNIVINEINYNSADSINSGDWIELYNQGNQTATLEGWYLSDENGNYFSLSSISILTGEYLVIAEDVDQFHSIYPNVNNVIGEFGVQGDWSFGFSNAGEKLSFINSDSSFIDFVDYNDKSPWPINADGEGATLQLISPDLDNNLAGNWIGDFPTPGKENFTGGKLDQMISFVPVTGKIATDEPFDILASSTSMLPIELELISGPGALDGNILTLDGVAGVFVFSANQQGNEAYYPANELIFQIIVDKAPQSIDYDSIADQRPSVGNLNIMANATSGLEIDLELILGPASLDGSMLTLTGEVGEVVIALNQLGDDTYSQASEKLIQFEVYKLEQSISITEIQNQFTIANPFDIEAQSDAFLPLEYNLVSGPATLDGKTITLNRTSGTVIFEVNQIGSIDYYEASEMSSFEVLKTEQVIDFPMLMNQLNTALPFKIFASATSDLSVGFEVISGPAVIVGDSVFLTGEVGLVEITASQTGDETYTAAQEVIQSFQVTAEPLLDQVITWTAIDDKYTFDLPFVVYAEASSELPIVYEIESGPATVYLDTVLLAGEPGEVFIRATQLGNEDYNPASAIIGFEVVEIVPENQTINFETIDDKLINDPDFQLFASASSGLNVNFEIISGPATIFGDVIQLDGLVGTVIIRAYQDGNNFYNPAEAFQEFKVEMVSGIFKFENKEVAVYPNPSEGIIQITSSAKFNSVEIYNVIGQVVWTAKQVTVLNQNSINLDLAHLEAGIYKLVVTDPDGRNSSKSIVIK